MTEQRRYSLDEIDRMRIALWNIETGAWGGGGTWNAEDYLRANRREDQLRTYMAGGVDPFELEVKASQAGERAEIKRLKGGYTTSQ